MYDFLKFYPVIKNGKKLVIEFIIDKFIFWQPMTTKQVDEKIREIFPVFCQLNTYCDDRDLDVVCVVDCDKALNYQRLNYVLLCEFISKLCEIFENTRLSRIEIKHCHTAILLLYNSSLPLIPESIRGIFNIYSNDKVL